jgi:hypothetical protein
MRVGWFEIFGVTVVMLFVGLFGYLLWFDVTHECVRRGKPETCYQTYCYGKPAICNTTPYDCTSCLEWKER